MFDSSNDPSLHISLGVYGTNMLVELIYYNQAQVPTRPMETERLARRRQEGGGWVVRAGFFLVPFARSTVEHRIELVRVWPEPLLCQLTRTWRGFVCPVTDENDLPTVWSERGSHHERRMKISIPISWMLLA